MNTENYILPFMWIRDGETDHLCEHIDIIQKSGCNALCVESRTHEYFCKEQWWTDFEIILRECRKRGMEVWLLDDKSFPTGYADGGVEENPELCQHLLIENNADVIGPVENHYLYVRKKPEDRVLGVFAYRRTGTDDTAEGEAIDLSAGLDGDRLYFSLPEGTWRVSFYIVTKDFGRAGYINMVDSRSANLMLERVYEPHYNHFKEYFGNTFKGFFTDEPGFGNDYFESYKAVGNIYDKRIGYDGIALPFSDELMERINKNYGKSALADFYGLWHPYGEKSGKIRLAYMNSATEAYAENFSGKLGDWCRQHGVQYIGHVIEDNGAHTRLGHGAGHYFRAIRGQDMTGIDVVLHQIMPGFSDCDNTNSCGSNAYTSDSAFFHYGLAKLASSLAHSTARMDNKSLCEIFGAYGWGAGMPLMKWLCDFMLVRGINHFVPHAFSLRYPDFDCPPHFTTDAYPQKEAFVKLMNYLGEMCGILSQGQHICDAAILYHAEAEWINFDCMPFHIPAKQLYDNQLDYDVIDGDTLKNSSVKNGKISVIEDYPCLIVPEAEKLPDYLSDKLYQLERNGARIIYVNSLPQGINGTAIPLSRLAEHIGAGHLGIKSDCRQLRFYHTRTDNKDIVMFFNESVTDTCNFSFISQNSAVKTDALHGKKYSVPAVNGRIYARLEPYQSVIFILGEEEEYPPEKNPPLQPKKLDCRWNISLFDTAKGSLAAVYDGVDKLFDLAGKNGLRDFCGHAIYSAEFDWEAETAGAVLEVKACEQTVKCCLNGVDLGLEICPPYRFDIGNVLRRGKNKITITVSNTLANRHNERLTTYFSIPPAGLTENPVVYL